jgi:ABC-type uncharacterized transport system auxiliary subunit
MKRFASFFLVLALAAVLIGCEKKEETAPPKDMPAVEAPAMEMPEGAKDLTDKAKEEAAKVELPAAE